MKRTQQQMARWLLLAVLFTAMCALAVHAVQDASTSSAMHDLDSNDGEAMELQSLLWSLEEQAEAGDGEGLSPAESDPAATMIETATHMQDGDAVQTDSSASIAALLAELELEASSDAHAALLEAAAAHRDAAEEAADQQEAIKDQQEDATNENEAISADVATDANVDTEHEADEMEEVSLMEMDAVSLPRPNVTDFGVTWQVSSISFTPGWFDVLDRGVANDYCRFVGVHRKPFLSCALAGSRSQYSAPGRFRVNTKGQVEKNPCFRVTCRNGGVCNSVTGLCSCRDGFHGRQCEQPSAECQTVDCGAHGRCIKGTCQCNKGWSGKRCQSNTCEANHVNCGEHGVCFDGKCHCSKLWTGDHCQWKARQVIDESTDGLVGPAYIKGWFDVSEQSGPSSLAEAGLREDELDAYTLMLYRQSRPGIENDYCRWVVPETTTGADSSDEHSNEPYLTCALAGSTSRYTPPGMVLWDPKMERPKINKCFRVRCKNDGHCDSSSGQCVCRSGFKGAQCELKESSDHHTNAATSSSSASAAAGAGTQCHGVDCGPNGVCSGGACLCKENWSGSRCDIDPCSNLHCGSHGSCQGGRCECLPKYYGDRCQYRRRQRIIAERGVMGRWVDAQKQGVKNDYCRIIGTRSSSTHTKPFVSCALAGARSAYTPPGAFRFARNRKTRDIDAILMENSGFDLDAALAEVDTHAEKVHAEHQATAAAAAASESDHSLLSTESSLIEDAPAPWDVNTVGCSYPEISPQQCGTGIGKETFLNYPQGRDTPAQLSYDKPPWGGTPLLHGQCLTKPDGRNYCACFGTKILYGILGAGRYYGIYGGTFCEVAGCPIPQVDRTTVADPILQFYVHTLLRSMPVTGPLEYPTYSLSYEGPASPTLAPFGMYQNAWPSSLTYQCKEGMVPAPGASMELKCSVRKQSIEDGRTIWTGALNVEPDQFPRCVPAKCEPLPPATPLTVVYNDPSQITNPQPGTTATYTCPSGFVARDGVEMTLTCNGVQWSAPIPTMATHCMAASCPELDDPNGDFEPDNGTIGTTSTLTCDDGYFSVSTETTCTQNRTWTGVTPSTEGGVAPVSCQPVTCSTIHAPEHGTTNGGTLAVTAVAGDMLSFACDAGYTLNGAASITCEQTSNTSSPTGVWSDPAPTCVPNTCQPAMSAPVHGTVSKVGSGSPASSSPINGVTGDVVQFACDQGYLLTGQSTSACTVDGTWSLSQPPTCSPAQCSREWTSLPNALHANLTTGYTSDVVGFSCAAGYELSGPAYLICGTDGEWSYPGSDSSTEPSCTPMACPTYTAPNPGVILSSTTGNFGDMIVFSCASGYNFIGQPSVKCVLNAAGTGVEWTPLPTQTNRRPQCWGSLSLQGLPFSLSVGSSVTFTMVPYAEVSSDLVVRLAIGGTSGATLQPTSVTFVPGPKTPVEITLTVPDGSAAGIADIEIQIEKNVIPPIAPPANSPVIFIDAGTQPVGRCSVRDSYRQFGGGYGAGSESEDALDLSSTGGPSYPFVVDSYAACFQLCSQHMECKQAIYKKSANQCYLMKNKYEGNAHGQDYMTANCLSGCPRLVPSANHTNLIINNPTGAFPGQVFPVEGQSAYFLCRAGTMLEGDRMSTCKADGTWDKPLPHCVQTPCAALNPSFPLQVSSTDGVAGDSVSFSCAQGWHLEKDVSFKCGPHAASSSRMWWSNPMNPNTGVSSDAPLPVCHPDACLPKATPPTNGVIHGEGTTNSSISYECNEGYTLDDQTSMKCTPSGWEGGDPAAPPKCHKNCPTIVAPKNGSLIPGAGQYHATQNVTLQCQAGFAVKGVTPATDSQVVSCTDTGSWSPIGPTFSCSPVSCPALPVNDSHVIVNGSRTTGVTGSVLHFSCAMGYTLSGSNTSTCVAGTPSQSVWSSAAPTCIPNPCPDLSVKGPTAHRILEGVTGTIVHPTCLQGYAPEPATALKCQPTGQWNGTAPECKPLPCHLNLTAPGNGTVSPTHGVTETRAVYTCSQGYTLMGSNMSICLNTGNWSNGAPTCKPNPCPVLDDVVHALPHVTSGVTGSIISIHCANGYVLTGSSSIQCMASGAWNASLPKCNPRPCPPLTPPAHGSVMPRTGVFGTNATYACDESYTLSSNPYTSCGADGKWTPSTPPTCIDTCANITCNNHGSCWNALCTCTDGWTGDHCQNPPVTYFWQIGAFGNCSVPCGGGNKERTVVCKGSDGKVYPDAKCVTPDTPKPATSQVCNIAKCVTYSWKAGAFGACSKPCGNGGTQTRTVECVGSDNKTYPDASCRSAGSKPVSSQSCNTQSCGDFKWIPSCWRKCSMQCGGGFHERTVSCMAPNGTIVDNHWCVRISPMPPTKDACNTFPCTNVAASLRICLDISPDAMPSSELIRQFRRDASAAARITRDRIEVVSVTPSSYRGSDQMAISVNFTIVPSSNRKARTVERVVRSLKKQATDPWSPLHRGLLTHAHDIDCKLRSFFFPPCSDGRFRIRCSDPCPGGLPTASGEGHPIHRELQLTQVHRIAKAMQHHSNNHDEETMKKYPLTHQLMHTVADKDGHSNKRPMYVPVMAGQPTPVVVGSSSSNGRRVIPYRPAPPKSYPVEWITRAEEVVRGPDGKLHPKPQDPPSSPSELVPVTDKKVWKKLKRSAVAPTNIPVQILKGSQTTTTKTTTTAAALTSLGGIVPTRRGMKSQMKQAEKASMNPTTNESKTSSTSSSHSFVATHPERMSGPMQWNPSMAIARAQAEERMYAQGYAELVDDIHAPGEFL